MFNGNANNGYSFAINSNGATTVLQAYTTSAVNAEWLEGPCHIGFRVYSSSRYFQGNTRPVVTSSLGNVVKVNEIVSSSANYSVEVPAGERLDWVKVTTPPQIGLASSQAGLTAWWRFDSAPVPADFDSNPSFENIPERTSLVFADGTDTSLLEAGDTVNQIGGPQPIWSTSTNGSESAWQNPENMYDGDDSTFAEVTFATSSNRFAKLLRFDGASPPQPNLFAPLSIEVTAALAPGQSGTVRLWEYGMSYNVDFNSTIVSTKTLNVPSGEVQGFRFEDLSSSTKFRVYKVVVDGITYIDNGPIPVEGTVDSVDDVTVTLDANVDGWVDGNNVTGPEKEVTGDDIKMYLQFDSNGNVIDLIPEPQSPVYAVSGINPSLTLTFPATFPSGQTPDEEIGEGSRLTVEVGAANSAGSTSYVGATVQPTGDPPSFQFREPLESVGGGASGEIAARRWSDFLNPSVGGWGGGTPKTNAFDGSLSTPAGTATTNANITWNCSSFPLSGQLTVYAEASPKGTSFVRIHTQRRHHNYYGCYG